VIFFFVFLGVVWFGDLLRLLRMYYPPPQSGYVPPPYPPQNMNMTGGYMAPPPPNMVPQGMYPVSMGGQPRPGPYPPQQPRPQQGPYPTQSPPMAPQQQRPPPQPAQPAVTPENMPLSQVDTLSDAQVEEMLTDEGKLAEFVKRLPYVQDYNLREQSVKQLQAEVDALAERISKNSELDATIKQAQEKRTEFQAKSAQKQAKDSELTPQALFDKLDVLAKAADTECEELVSKFTSGEMTAQEFAKAYKEKRFHYHTLCAKKESILHNM